MNDAHPVFLRPVIVATLAVCLGVAMAPWMSGGQEPLAVLISAMALVLAALLSWMQPEVRALKRGPLVVSFGVLIGLGVLSLLWTANRYSTAVWVTEWVMAGLAFRTAYVLAGEPRGRELMLRVYLVSAGVFSVAAIIMYFFSDYERLTGTFYWANPAAAYLIPAIIIAVDRLRRASGKLVYWWAAAVAFGIATFLLADSRAATLVLVLTTGLYLLVASTPRRFWITFVFTVLAAIMVTFGLFNLSNRITHKGVVSAPGSRFAEAAKGESVSGSDRLYYLESAFEIWFAHPVLGTGAGTFGDVHPRYQQRVISASDNVHNVYAQVLAELGLAGAAALAAVLLWLLGGVFKGLVAAPEMVPVAIGVFGLAMHAGLDIDASYPSLLLLAAVLLGLVYRQWGQWRERASWRWPVYAALIVVPVVSLYLSDTWGKRALATQEDGDYALAAAQFDRARSGLVYNPDLINASGIARYTLATTGGSQARPLAKQALDLAVEAERSDPWDGQHHQLEGRVLALRGDIPGALRALREALRLDPYNHPDYALDLATMQRAGGDDEGALKTAQAMTAQYPAGVVSNRSTDTTVRPALANLEALMGNIYLVRGDLAQARAAADSALAYYPASIRGRALMNQLRK